MAEHAVRLCLTIRGAVAELLACRRLPPPALGGDQIAEPVGSIPGAPVATGARVDDDSNPRHASVYSEARRRLKPVRPGTARATRSGRGAAPAPAAPDHRTRRWDCRGTARLPVAGRRTPGARADRSANRAAHRWRCILPFWLLASAANRTANAVPPRSRGTAARILDVRRLSAPPTSRGAARQHR